MLHVEREKEGCIPVCQSDCLSVCQAHRPSLDMQCGCALPVAPFSLCLSNVASNE